MFVAGEWVGARSGETFSAESPATGETIGEVPAGDRDDARRAIEAANRAADAWARTSAFERAAALRDRLTGDPRQASVLDRLACEQLALATEAGPEWVPDRP